MARRDRWTVERCTRTDHVECGMLEPHVVIRFGRYVDEVLPTFQQAWEHIGKRLAGINVSNVS